MDPVFLFAGEKIFPVRFLEIDIANYFLEIVIRGTPFIDAIGILQVDPYSVKNHFLSEVIDRYANTKGCIELNGDLMHLIQ